MGGLEWLRYIVRMGGTRAAERLLEGKGGRRKEDLDEDGLLKTILTSGIWQ